MYFATCLDLQQNSSVASHVARQSSLSLQGLVVVTTLLGICISWLLLRSSKRSETPRNHKQLRLPPNASPYAIPFLTDDTVKFLSGKAGGLTRQRFQQFGGMPVRSRFFGRSMTHLFTQQHVRKVLGAEHDLVRASWQPGTLELLGKNSLIGIHGETHRKLRRLLAPAFTPLAIESYLPQIQNITEAYCSRWGQQKDIELVKEVRGLTFQVMLDVMMGFRDWVEDGRMETARDLFNTWLKGLFSPAIRIPGTAFHTSLQARKQLLQLIDQSVAAKCKVLRGSGECEGKAGGDGSQPPPEVVPQCLLDSVIGSTDEDGNYMTREQLGDLVMNMLFAGHDTSASTLMYLLWTLSSSHPEVVQKLREEQREVIEKFGGSVTGDALRAMKYTTAVVNEVLRVKPIVGAVPRKALKDFELDGYWIHKDTPLFVHTGISTVYDTCKGSTGDTGDASHAPAESFAPDRWLVDGGVRSAAWMPFGGGPRMCLGYTLALPELKIILAVLARGWQWSTPGPDLQWDEFPILRPAGDSMTVTFSRLPA